MLIMNLIFDEDTYGRFNANQSCYLQRFFQLDFFKTLIFSALFLFFFFSSFFLTNNSYSQGVNQLLNIDLQSSKNQIYEFSIETYGKPSCKSFVLETPDRVVVDIGDIDNSTIFKAKTNKIKKDSFVKNVRKGKFKDKIRVVFDLNDEGVVDGVFVESIDKAKNLYKAVVKFRSKSIKSINSDKVRKDSQLSSKISKSKKKDSVDDLDNESKEILSDLMNPLKLQNNSVHNNDNITKIKKPNDNNLSADSEVVWDKLILNELSSVDIDLDIVKNDEEKLGNQLSQSEENNNEILASQPDTESTISDIISDIIVENVGYEVSDDGVRLSKDTSIGSDTEEGVYYEISPNAVSDSEFAAPVLKKEVLNILKSRKMDEVIIAKLKPKRIQKPEPKLIFDNSDKTNSKIVSESPESSVLVGRLSVEDIIEVRLKPKFVVMKKRPVISKRKRKDKPIIVIDAGHGGKDPGAVGRRGTREKNLTLLYAKTLKRELEKKGKYKVYMIRNRDIFISLSGRVRRARKYKGDLFISIHADSSTAKKARGLSVYTLSEVASDKEAGRLARRENKVGIVTGANFKGQQAEILRTLIDLSQRETMNSSTKYAGLLLKELRIRHASLKQQALRHAGFTVLSAPDIPSVLLEIGYLSNRKEEKAMKTTSYRNKIVKSVAISIDKFFANRKVYY